MRRFSNYLMVPALLAMVGTCAVAGQASAAQERQRSAPPSSSSRGSSGSSSQSQGSGKSTSPDRGSSQAQSQRRESPSRPQSSGPSRPQSSGPSRPQPSAPSSSRDSRNNDPRSNSGVRGGDSRATLDSRNSSRNNDVRGNNDSRNFSSRNDGGRLDNRSVPQRQAIPAPRDRYMDLNRNGRDDRYEGSRFSYPYRNERYSSRYVPLYRYSSSYRYTDYRYGGRVYFAPSNYQRFSSAWFSFRPYSRLAIGLTIGYPVAFPTWYDARIIGPSGYARPTMAYGGLTFDVEPRDADLWVDGDYIGPVSDYTSYDPPLTLVAGRHHVEIAVNDDRAIEFDVTVVSGQVIPYQGTLPYIR